MGKDVIVSAFPFFLSDNTSLDSTVLPDRPFD